MKLVTMTPHSLNVYGDEGLIASFPPSGRVARLAEQRESCPPVALGMTVLDVSRPTYGEALTVEWDSDTQKAVPGSEQPWETPTDEIVVVSAIALDGLAKTGHDCSRVFAPGPAIRDDAGRQIGCHGLSAAPPARAERTWDDRDHACEHGVDLSDDCPACGRVWPPLAKEITDLADNPAIDWRLDVGDLMYAEWRAGAQGGAPPPQHQTLAEAFQRHDLSHA